jgi:hypothetical protein
MLHVFFNVPLINSLSAKKKNESMANVYSELAPNVIFNKDPTAVPRLHERPQATDNSMQLLNLHQTNGNGNQTTQFYFRWVWLAMHQPKMP